MTSRNETSKGKTKSKTNFGKSQKSCNPKNSKQSGNKDVKDTTDIRGNARDNDPSWYTAYPGIYSSTSNISFNQPVGVGLDLDDVSGSAIANSGTTLNVPNVMAFDLVFTPGVSDNAASVVNTAMFQNYNFVRHANSGSKNYDAVDLQMYYMAVNEALALLWEGIRAYGTLTTFSALNRALPTALFSAYGFNYASWRANPAQVRAKLNLAATKMGSLCVPNTSRLLARMSYLMSNVFMDGDNIKSQYYVFRMGYVHKWGKVSQVGKLIATAKAKDMTVDAYFELLDSVLQPLLEDEDINIMSGDVLKAYGSGNLLPIPMVPEIYGTPIVTSKENPFMMSQIENAQWVGSMSNYDITQSANGYIEFHPTKTTDNANSEVLLTIVKNLLNSRNAEVSSEEVMELTRLTPVYDSQATEDGTKVNVTVRSCGSEIIDRAFIYTYVNGAVTSNEFWKCSATMNAIPLPYFNFDWAPLLYIGAILKEGEKYTGRVTSVIGDLSNYTAISKNTTKLIHETALASEYLLDQPSTSKY